MITLVVAVVLLSLIVANVALGGAVLTAGLNRSISRERSREEKVARRRISYLSHG